MTPVSSSFVLPACQGMHFFVSLLVQGTPKLLLIFSQKTFIYSLTIRTNISMKDMLNVVHMLVGLFRMYDVLINALSGVIDTISNFVCGPNT